MTVETFVKEYNMRSSLKLKDDYVKAHIVKDYLNYEEKLAICKGVVDTTSYVRVEGKKVYNVNTPAEYMHFVLRIIMAYTDIEIGKDNNMLADFNLLDKNNLIDIIIESIDKSEIQKMRTVLKMMKADIESNERTLVSYLENKMNLLKLFDGITLPPMTNVAEETEIKND